MDPPELSNYYKTVNVNSTTFLDNALSMTRLEVGRMWNALGKPVDRDEWGMTAPTVNACEFLYYSRPPNR
jgi:endothelin-converting enzyme